MSSKVSRVYKTMYDIGSKRYLCCCCYFDHVQTNCDIFNAVLLF